MASLHYATVIYSRASPIDMKRTHASHFRGIPCLIGISKERRQESPNLRLVLQRFDHIRQLNAKLKLQVVFDWRRGDICHQLQSEINCHCPVSHENLVLLREILHCSF